MDKLSSEQQRVGKLIQALFENFKKDSDYRKVPEYLIKRISNLNDYWTEFKETDGKIQKIKETNPEHHYFEQKYYEQVEFIYNEAITLMSQKLQEKQKTLPSTSEIEDKKQDEEQKRRFKRQEAKTTAFLRIVDSVENPDDTQKNKAYFHQKIKILSDYWSNVTTTHDEIMTYITTSDQENDYIKMNRYSELEDLYQKTVINLQTNYDTITTSQPPLGEQTSSAQTPKLMLPQLNIPQFSGNYNNWISFYDLFSQLIHTNNTLGKAQKMYYLKANLSGEAGKLLQHLQTTDENYDTAWELLSNRYNNKRILVSTQLQILLNQKNLTFECANGLKALHDTTKECLHALKNLQINIDHWDPIMIHILTQKLDKETHRLYEQSLKQPREIQKLEQFFKFLEARFQTLEAIGERSRKDMNLNSQFKNYKAQPQTNKFELKSQQFPAYKNYCSTIKTACYICRGEHSIQACTKYLTMNPKQRLDLIRDHKLCTNCLSANHRSLQCKTWRTCQICHKKHHTTLHFQEENNRNIASTPSHHVRSTREEENKNISTNMPTKVDKGIKILSHLSENNERNNNVLLATALIQVISENGNIVTVRALIDQGSQATFITESTVQRLQLKKSKTHATIAGVGATKTDISKHTVQLKIRSRFPSTFECRTTALVLTKITKLLPGQVIKDNYKHLSHLLLADPTYNKPGPIDILLGADVFGEIILNGVLRGPNGSPVAQQTELGWILSGKINHESENKESVVCLIAQTNIDDDLKQFWEMEDLHPVRQHTVEEVQCEKFYDDTVKRTATGRYIVRIPFKPETNIKTLGNSKGQAVARLIQMEKKFSTNKNLALEYKKFMAEYLNLHHMIEAKPIKSEITDSVYYLPHHAVMKENSTTTKLRVVFDASAKTSSGITLNEKMMIGPILQQELVSTLLRWRKHKIAYTADIEKMYRQIQVSKDDQNYQRIVWRNNISEQIKEYKLTTVTYGTSAAPYLAVKTLRKLAQDDRSKYPIASKITLEDFYVDDLLSGNDNLAEAKQAQEQLINLLKGGGFKLRKWACNEPKLLTNISKDRQEEESLQIPLGETVKTLGVFWSPKNDQFEFKINLPLTTNAPTKRTIVSETAKLFDPMGWLAPSIVLAKILHQELWLTGVSWDEPIPSSISIKWNKLRKDLTTLEKIKIPRWINYTKKAVQTELHGFCDASEKAYAAVIYSRVITDEGEIIVTLMTGKTRVAPISKKLTLPQLELSGALLLAKLMKQVKDAIDIQDIATWAWTDSTIVLAWLHGHPNKWKTFVANRVSEIHSLINADKWHHVKSSHNPADCASRGIPPNQLQETTLWWKGPTWLSELIIHKDKKISATTDLESKKTIKCYTNIKDSGFLQEILIKYSSQTKLTRILAFCRRFINNARINRNIRKVGPLQRSETDEVTEILIIHTQRDAFCDEIRQLKKGQPLHRQSKILSLNPFIDGNNILRVGGRLQQSDLLYEEKHPIILPHTSPLTKMIIDNIHRSTLHGGNTLTLAQVRSKYWIINGLSAVRQHIRKCIICHRYNAESCQQLMGSFPKPRISISRPFTHTGVDYAGPIDVKMSPGRGNKSYKGYIAIFICLATKAIHIELVSNLTAQGFIAAFKRMVGRRGNISHIYSDNATNFILASKILKLNKNQYLEEYQNVICDQLGHSGTEWHFIPPVSPNFGGLWEAGVKSIKFHLKRSIGEIKLTYEELTTTLIQIEACLNSRPLCPMTEDINSVEVLTPGHFLIGAPLLAPPDKNVLNDNINILSKWQLLSRITQNFWKKWSSEYLSRLQQRPKWTQQQRNIEIGDLVLLKDEQLPPAKWALGRILDTHPGEDGLTRVVTLKTTKSILKRPVSKLSLLPININASTSSNTTSVHHSITKFQRPIQEAFITQYDTNEAAKQKIKNTKNIFINQPQTNQEETIIKPTIPLTPGKDTYLKQLVERFKSIKPSRNKIRINPTNIPVRPSLEELRSYNASQKNQNLSNQQRKRRQTDSISSNLKRSREDPRQARNFKHKIRYPNALLSMLMVTMIVLPTLAQKITEPYEITPFVNRPGIYFEELGDIGISNNEWNIIVYYDLKNYWHELIGFRQLVNKATNMCKINTVWQSRCHSINKELNKATNNCKTGTSWQSHCQSISQELNQHLQVLERNNDLLHQRNSNDDNILSRIKKAPLEIIGNIAHAMFGVLDAEFAKQHEAQIQNIKNNENHLLDLIKNQTSITESTLNIIKKSQKEIDHQFEIVEGHLENITNTVKNNNADQNAQQDFISLALYITIIISHYEQTQNALISAVLDIQHSKINHLLLTPAQLRQQLTMIKTNLPPTLKIPADNKKSELLQIYALLSTTARVTKNNIIVDIRIPLIVNEYYQLFKIIPIPTEHENELVIIKPSTDYLAVTLHREKYFPMTYEELKQCQFLGETYICKQRQPVYNQFSNLNRCEMDILSHQKVLSSRCRLQVMERAPVWIQLHNSNSWIYILDQDYTFNIICGTSVIERTLNYDGILKLQPNCEINQKSLTIRSHNVISNRINSAFIPTTNLTDQLRFNRMSNKSRLVVERQKILSFNELEAINKTIIEVKRQQHLPSTISPHDIHHYSIIYSSLILILISIAGYVLWKVKKAKEQKTEEQDDPTRSTKEATHSANDFRLRINMTPEDVQYEHSV